MNYTNPLPRVNIAHSGYISTCFIMYLLAYVSISSVA